MFLFQTQMNHPHTNLKHTLLRTYLAKIHAVPKNYTEKQNTLTPA